MLLRGRHFAAWQLAGFFFLVNPWRASTWQMVGADTCFPSMSATSWHISCKYRLGFSETNPTMNISSRASSLLKDSLTGCFCYIFPPFLLNAAKAVLHGSYTQISSNFSEIQPHTQALPNYPPVAIRGVCCFSSRLCRSNIRNCADWLRKFKLPTNCLLAACAGCSTQHALCNKSAVRSELKSAVLAPLH